MSCARDGQTRPAAATAAVDRSAAPGRAPRIARHQGLVELPAWDKSPDKSLTLNDTLDFGAGQPRGAEVTAHCGEGAGEVVHHSYFEAPESISIYQTLPEGILTRDLAKTPETCRYEITLKYEAGPRHGYLMTAVIHDDGQSAVRLDANGAKVPERLTIDKVSGIKLRYDGGGGRVQARLMCADVKFPALPFNQVLDVSNFDLGEVARSEANHAITMSINPVQTCRFSIEEVIDHGRAAESSRRLAVSKLLAVQFNHGIWWLEPVPVPEQTGRLADDGSVTIADYRVHNLDDKIHRVHANKIKFGAKAQIFYPNPQYATEMANDGVGIEVIDVGGPGHLNDGTMSVAAGDSLHLRVKYFVDAAIKCRYSALKVSVTEPIFLQDIGDHDEVRASIEIPAAKPGLLIVNPEAHVVLPETPNLLRPARDFTDFMNGGCSL